MYIQPSPRKNYERGGDYFWNKFYSTKSDLSSVPFNPNLHTPWSPQAALWLFTALDLPFSWGPVSRLELPLLQYLHVFCLTQVILSICKYGSRGILWSQTMHTFNGTDSAVLVCKTKRRVGEKWWLNSAWGPLFYSESRFCCKDSMRVRTLIFCLISWVLSGSVSYPTRVLIRCLKIQYVFLEQPTLLILASYFIWWKTKEMWPIYCWRKTWLCWPH